LNSCLQIIRTIPLDRPCLSSECSSVVLNICHNFTAVTNYSVACGMTLVTGNGHAMAAYNTCLCSSVGLLKTSNGLIFR